MTPFQITRVDPERYRLSGELDMASAPTLDDALQPVVDAHGSLVLELEELTFIDSYGIRSLVQLSSRMNGSGPLVLTKVPVSVQRIFDIVGAETLPGIEVSHDG